MEITPIPVARDYEMAPVAVPMPGNNAVPEPLPMPAPTTAERMEVPLPAGTKEDQLEYAVHQLNNSLKPYKR
jgi:hypothetical protein